MRVESAAQQIVLVAIRPWPELHNQAKVGECSFRLFAAVVVQRERFLTGSRLRLALQAVIEVLQLQRKELQLGELLYQQVCGLQHGHQAGIVVLQSLNYGSGAFFLQQRSIETFPMVGEQNGLEHQEGSGLLAGQTLEKIREVRVL